MKVREICEKLRSGEMTLDFAGHYIGIDLNRLLERYDEQLELENGSNDGKWSTDDHQTIEQRNQSMREFFKKGLDREVSEEQSGFKCLHDLRQCSNCGESLHWTLTGNKLQLRNHYVEDSSARLGIRDENYPVDYICPYNKPKPFESQIEIRSKLLFANFFISIEDTTDSKKYSKEYSLESVAGRYGIASYKANQNVAYGQMTNTCIGIYLNEAKDSVIIGPRLHPAEYGDYDTDQEYEDAMSKPLFPGYEMVGELGLDVWRWEATDLLTLEKTGVSLEQLHEQHACRGVVEIDVRHGIWRFQHNEDVVRVTGDEKQFNFVYARMDLESN